MVADAVDSGCVLVDVGTDHANLPVWLVLNSRVKSAVAADLRQGPLDNARKTVREYEVEDRVRLVLSNGLEMIEPGDYNISLAGMGGTLTVNILSAAPWIKRKGTHLLLQPQSHAYDVRKWLYENGFETEYEKACFDGGHHYVLISSRYVGKISAVADERLYLGKLCLCDDENAKNVIRREYNHISKMYEGAVASGDREKAERLLNALKYINNYLGENENDKSQ